VGAGATPA